MSTLNIPLAREVLEHLEAHPEEHDQAAFARENECGTTLCIAGHSLLLSGQYGLTQHADGLHEFDFIDKADRQVVTLPSLIAQGLLGLSFHEQDRLFFQLQNEGEALNYLRELIEDAEK